jgi:hypothetical protein
LRVKVAVTVLAIRARIVLIANLIAAVIGLIVVHRLLPILMRRVVLRMGGRWAGMNMLTIGVVGAKFIMGPVLTNRTARGVRMLQNVLMVIVSTAIAGHPELIAVINSVRVMKIVQAVGLIVPASNTIAVFLALPIRIARAVWPISREQAKPASGLTSGVIKDKFNRALLYKKMMVTNASGQPNVRVVFASTAIVVLHIFIAVMNFVMMVRLA